MLFSSGVLRFVKTNFDIPWQLIRQVGLALCDPLSLTGISCYALSAWGNCNCVLQCMSETYF